MTKYGDLMPYTKYGTTTVYFFGARQPFPKERTAGEPHFDAKFANHCLAVYTKDANGQVSSVQDHFEAFALFLPVNH